MNLYHYIHSTLRDAISEKYPEIDQSRIRIYYQVSPVNKTYICTPVPRVIMSMLNSNHNSTTIAHELVSCITPDETFINPDIFICDGFINFQVSLSYAHHILRVQPAYDLSLLKDIIGDNNFQEKLKRLLNHADSFYPENTLFPNNEFPLLNHTETAIITLIAFTEFTKRESTQPFIINSLVSLLKKYYCEVPVFTKDVVASAQRIRLIKQVCSVLYHQKKSAQSTR
jgi:hypothetical protein